MDSNSLILANVEDNRPTAALSRNAVDFKPTISGESPIDDNHDRKMYENSLSFDLELSDDSYSSVTLTGALSHMGEETLRIVNDDFCQRNVESTFLRATGHCRESLNVSTEESLLTNSSGRYGKENCPPVAFGPVQRPISKYMNVSSPIDINPSRKSRQRVDFEVIEGEEFLNNSIDTTREIFSKSNSLNKSITNTFVKFQDVSNETRVTLPCTNVELKKEIDTCNLNQGLNEHFMKNKWNEILNQERDDELHGETLINSTSHKMDFTSILDASHIVTSGNTELIKEDKSLLNTPTVINRSLQSPLIDIVIPNWHISDISSIEESCFPVCSQKSREISLTYCLNGTKPEDMKDSGILTCEAEINCSSNNCDLILKTNHSLVGPTDEVELNDLEKTGNSVNDGQLNDSNFSVLGGVKARNCTVKECGTPPARKGADTENALLNDSKFSTDKRVGYFVNDSVQTFFQKEDLDGYNTNFIDDSANNHTDTNGLRNERLNSVLASPMKFHNMTIKEIMKQYPSALHDMEDRVSRADLKSCVTIQSSGIIDPETCNGVLTKQLTDDISPTVVKSSSIMAAVPSFDLNDGCQTSCSHTSEGKMASLKSRSACSTVSDVSKDSSLWPSMNVTCIKANLTPVNKHEWSYNVKMHTEVGSPEPDVINQENYSSNGDILMADFLTNSSLSNSVISSVTVDSNVSPSKSDIFIAENCDHLENLPSSVRIRLTGILNYFKGQFRILSSIMKEEKIEHEKTLARLSDENKMLKYNLECLCSRRHAILPDDPNESLVHFTGFDAKYETFLHLYAVGDETKNSISNFNNCSLRSSCQSFFWDENDIFQGNVGTEENLSFNGDFPHVSYLKNINSSLKKLKGGSEVSSDYSQEGGLTSSGTNLICPEDSFLTTSADGLDLGRPAIEAVLSTRSGFSPDNESLKKNSHAGFVELSKEEFDELSAKIELLTSEKNEYFKKSVALESDLVSSADNTVQLKACNETLKCEVEQLQSKLASLNVSYAEAGEHNKRQRETLCFLGDQYKTLEISVQNSKTQIEAFRGSLNGITKAIKRYTRVRENLDNSFSIIDDLKSKLKALSDDYISLRNETAENRSGLESKLKIKEENFRKLKDEQASLSQKADFLRVENSNLKEFVIKLKESYDFVVKGLFTSDLATLKVECASLEDKVGKIKTEHDCSAKLFQRLSDDHSSLKALFESDKFQASVERAIECSNCLQANARLTSFGNKFCTVLPGTPTLDNFLSLFEKVLESYLSTSVSKLLKKAKTKEINSPRSVLELRGQFEPECYNSWLKMTGLYAKSPPRLFKNKSKEKSPTYFFNEAVTKEEDKYLCSKQDPDCCCKELNEQLKELKLELVDRNSKITGLELRLEVEMTEFTKKISTIEEYKRKVRDVKGQLWEYQKRDPNNFIISRLQRLDKSTQTSETETLGCPSKHEPIKEEQMAVADEKFSLHLSVQPSGILLAHKVKEQEKIITKLRKDKVILERLCSNRSIQIKGLKVQLETAQLIEKKTTTPTLVTQRYPLEDVSHFDNRDLMK